MVKNPKVQHTVTVCGPVPANIQERITAAHAEAVRRMARVRKAPDAGATDGRPENAKAV